MSRLATQPSRRLKLAWAINRHFRKMALARSTSCIKDSFCRLEPWVQHCSTNNLQKLRKRKQLKLTSAATALFLMASTHYTIHMFHGFSVHTQQQPLAAALSERHAATWQHLPKRKRGSARPANTRVSGVTGDETEMVSILLHWLK